jgi:hypothetical protein
MRLLKFSNPTAYELTRRSSNVNTVVALAMTLLGCGGHGSDQASSDHDGDAFEADSSASPMGDAGSPSGPPGADAVDADSCVISASDYDQTCTSDTDCVVVSTGDCYGQTCSHGGINVDAFGAYMKAVAAARITLPVGPSCLAGPPCCQAGLCAECLDAGAPTPDDGGDTVLCVKDAGPQDSGPAVSGLSLWCSGSQMCTPFNGEWECCEVLGMLRTCYEP